MTITQINFVMGENYQIKRGFKLRLLSNFNLSDQPKHCLTGVKTL